MVRASTVVSLLIWLLLSATAVADSTVVTGAWDCYGYNATAAEATNNYGGSTAINAGDYYGVTASKYVAWLKFDMSEYTAGSSAFDSAVIWLYVSAQTTGGGGWQSDSDSIYAIHILATEYEEGGQDGTCPYDSVGASYNKRQCYDANGGQCNCGGGGAINLDWDVAGSWGADVDYDTSNVHPDSVTFSWKGSAGYHYINASHLVDYQIANTNYGFRISEEVEAASGQYAYITVTSTEAGSNEPKLVIYYSEVTAAGQVIIVD